VLYDSYKPIGTADVAPLRPGDSFVCSFQWPTSDVTPIRHQLLVQVNSEMDFTEKNDTNNEMRVNLTFRGDVDLAVRSITFSLSLNESNATADVTVGQTLWIWVNVANLGTIGSAVNTTLSLFLDDSRKAFKSFLLYPIVPGHDFTSQYGWDTSTLNDTVVTGHSVRAVVDPLSINNDSDPSNNQLSVNLTVHPPAQRADLAILDIRLSGPTVRSEEVLAITAMVTNIGGQPASNFTVRFTYQSGPFPQLIGDQAIASIRPGEVLNITENWTVLVGEGNYTVNIVIDPQNNIIELSKANNIGSTQVAILQAEQQAPRLTITVPAFLPANPRPGQTVEITVTVANIGTAPASGLLVTLLVDGRSGGNKTIPDIAPGANYTVTMSWKAVSGAKIICRVTGANVPGLDSTAVPVEVKADKVQEPASSSLPVLIVIVILLAAVVAIIAVGGRKKRPDEEE
jgi:subtilase family serine protease